MAVAVSLRSALFTALLTSVLAPAQAPNPAQGLAQPAQLSPAAQPSAAPQLSQPGSTQPTAPSSRAMHLSLTLTGDASTNLQNGSIRVLDNGAPLPTEGLQPMQSGSAPTHVLLVIDDVNARLTTIAYERDQLKKFFTRNEGHLSVPIGIAIMTDTKTEVQQGFSQNGIAENDALQNYKIGLHEIRRDSQYGGFDRTDIGVKTLLQLVAYAATIPGHKLILFVSPGWPLLSGPSIELTAKEQSGIFNTVVKLQNALLRSNTTISMVNPFGPAENLVRSDYYQSFLKGVKKTGDVDIADLSLQVIAVHSGGTVQQGTSDIGNMVDRAVADLNHGYTLTFQPAATEDRVTYHRLQVEGNPPGVAVRTPDEYYEAPSAAGTER